MEVKLKKIGTNIYEIVDCENLTFIGKKIRIDYDKNCFWGPLNLGRYYDLDTAGDVWDVKLGQLIGYWTEV